MNTNAALGNNRIAAPSILHRTVAWLASVTTSFRRTALRERTRRELVRLTDHELRDIGLVRGDIDKIVRNL